MLKARMKLLTNGHPFLIGAGAFMTVFSKIVKSPVLMTDFFPIRFLLCQESIYRRAEF